MPSRDPFSSLPDIAAYQPRPATERALGLLAEAVHFADRPVVLEGPPGIGKTLLLHLLAHRVELRGELRAVAVPIPTLTPDEFWHWVAARLALPSGDNPLAALSNSCKRSTPVLLLIDDANSLPVATLDALARELAAQGAKLRAVLVSSDDEQENAAFFEALGEPIYRIRFAEPMTAEETAAYVCARLAEAEVDAESLARFDDAMLARLHEHARGVPAAVHEIADLLVRPDEAARAHELAPELRPEIVSTAAARRRIEGVERISEWGDEDLAKAVGRRGARNAGGIASAGAASVEALDLFAPDEAEDAPLPVATHAAEAAEVPAATVAVARPAAPKRKPSPVAPRPRAPRPTPPALGATSSSSRSPAALRIAAAAAALVGVAALAAWQFDAFAAPKPTHVVSMGGPPAAVPVPAPAVSAAPPNEMVEEPPIAAEPERIEHEVASDEIPEPSPPVVTVQSASPTPEPVVEALVQAPEPNKEVREPAAQTAPAVAPTLAAPVLKPIAKVTAATTPASPPTAPAAMPLIAAVAGQRPPSEIAVAPSDLPLHLARVLAPAGTRVEIGDSVRGTAPLASVLLNEGDHRVRWALANGDVGEQVFRVDAEHSVLDISAAIGEGVPPVSSR